MHCGRVACRRSRLYCAEDSGFINRPHINEKISQDVTDTNAAYHKLRECQAREKAEAEARQKKEAELITQAIR